MDAVFEASPAARQTVQHSRSRLLLSTIFLVFWAIALALQYLGNAYASDLNVESDDPAHYVTGLMIHDYIRLGFPWPPAHFAQNYYAHYPKVAIGHWPPVFYVLQGVWMTLCGDSIHSDLVFMALLSALFATTLYALAAQELRSKIAGLGLALLLLLIPVQQIFSSTVMADLPVALFCLWATVLWGRYLERGSAKAMAGFAIFASLAILTKGNGYALLLVPPITILLTRRFSLLKDSRLWTFGALILLLCAPWSFLTRELVVPTLQYKLTPGFVVSATVYYFSQLFWQSGWVVALFVTVGVTALLVHIARRQAAPIWIATLSWLAAFLAFHVLVPAGLEMRYIILVLPAWLMLMAYGIVWTAEHLRLPRTTMAARAIALSAVVAIAFAAFSFYIPRRHDPGFKSLARTVAQSPEFRKKVVLVSSEGDGEGMFISELAQFDTPRPKHIVIRASRALANSDWNQSTYSLVFQTPEEVQQYVESIPIGVVILDRTARFRPNLHQALLEQMIERYPQRWKLFGTYPAGVSASHSIAVYELQGPRTIPNGPVAIEISGTAHLKLLVEP